MHGSPCPYFGKNSKVCEVGCVPATPAHLETISTLCAFSYRDCDTYKNLDRRSATAFSGESRSGSAPAAAGGMGSLGLIYWGASLLILVLAQSGLPLMSVHGLAWLMVVSAVIQIFSGLRSLSSAPIRAVAFTGYGLFWLSMIALEILPRAGVGTSPGTASLAPYLILWSFFGTIICQEKVLLSRGCRLTFGLFSLALLFQAGALFLDASALCRVGMIIGGNAGLLAVAFGLAPIASRKGRPMTAVRPT